VSSAEPRLRQATDLPRAVKYATLSHCWGTHTFLTLMKDNLNDFLERIPPEALSKTFQDAIDIVQYLGYQYLWIDSLCIMQDDDDDWKKESALMTQVYGGSQINIAAAGAANGSQGCFFNRKVTWRCQVRVEVMGRVFICYSSNFAESFNEMPLMARGWVLQERMLARRTIYFTKTEVFWECRRGMKCETFTNRLPSLTLEDFRNLPTSWFTDTSSWSQIIMRYSRCKLTKGVDKLVAVSGLARLIHEMTDEVYIAGMWRRGLEEQLLWGSNGHNATTPSKSYRAPSWSWASTDGEVNIPYIPDLDDDYDGYSNEDDDCEVPSPHELYICVQDVQVENSPASNAFGEVVSANLRLRVELLVSRCRTDDNHGLLCQDIFMNEKAIQILTLFDQPTEQLKGEIPFYLLPVRGNLYDQDPDITGLMLQPTGNVKGQYKRIGKFFFQDVYESMDFLEMARREENKATNDDFAHISIDADGRRHQYIDLV
jgi:hypothetical protein